MLRVRDEAMADEEAQLGLADKPEDKINRNIFDNMYNKISELVSISPPFWLFASRYG